MGYNSFPSIIFGLHKVSLGFHGLEWVLSDIFEGPCEQGRRRHTEPEVIRLIVPHSGHDRFSATNELLFPFFFFWKKYKYFFFFLQIDRCRSGGQASVKSTANHRYRLLLGYNGFEWVYTVFTGLYLGLIGFSQVHLAFHRVLLGLTGFDWVWLGFTGFDWVWLGLTGFYWVLLGLTGFDWVLLGLTGFDWVLRGCTELERLFLVFDWFLLVWLGSKWVSMGSTGFKMGSLGTGGGAPAWGVICILNGQSTAGSVGIKTDTLMG